MEQINTHKKILGGIVAMIMLVFIMGACSTEKNTWANRTYHSTTARYNGLFNAREMIRLGLLEYRLNAHEDFTTILPIELFPTEEDVQDFYPIVDTAIVKCQKVIQQHSMPTASKPSQKKTEHARWIDKNWLMIGYAQYIRRDYEEALTTFTYVRKFFDNKSSSYSAQIWEVKTLIQLGDLYEAKRGLQRLEAKVASIDDKPDKKQKKKGKKEDKTPKLPKNFAFELAKTKAMLALAENDHDNAIIHVQMALKKAKKKEDKARLNFIMGQLLQEAGNPNARDYYSKSIKKDAPFEMSFNAKINRALVSNLNDDNMVKELTKLSKELRYLEFRDQIYFAMSKIELKRNNREAAKKDLSSSVFYSLNNNLQKGISYETLGDLYFNEKNYVFAQRYYDSSATVLPESYERQPIIKNKAQNLFKLVENIDIVTFEDSIQRIASMDENAREKYLKDVIKQMQKDEQERKEREAERAEQMRKLQQTYAEQNQKTGSKFYFSNAKAIQNGANDFKNLWGNRENSDYWRLADKPIRVSMDLSLGENEELDSLTGEKNQTKAPSKTSLDSLGVDDLLADIPLTEKDMEASNDRLIEALYNSGIIYKEQLEEVGLASEQFQRIIDKNIEHERNVMAAFQLYKINEAGNPAPYRTYILDKYPDSDYANYLRDPDFFIKKKERDALALKDYLRSVTNYEQGLFYPVIIKADNVIENELDNPYRKEYFLLKAMAMGRVNPDKNTLIPVLEQGIEEYPGSDVAARCQDLIDLINNGIPDFEEYVKAETGIFGLDAKSYYVIVEVKVEENATSIASRVSDYNNLYFNRQKLSARAQIYDDNISFIQISEFATSGAASAYIKDFRNAKRYVQDLKDHEMFLVSKENYKIILLDKKLSDYKRFYYDNF